MLLVWCVQVSRLQNGADVGREVHAQSSGELSYPVEDYVLYWPDKRVRRNILEIKKKEVLCYSYHDDVLFLI